MCLMHTRYLSYFLHRQNCWLSFTPHRMLNNSARTKMKMFAFNRKFLHVAVWSLQRHWHGSEHLGHISKSKRQTSWKSLLWSPETLWKSWKSWEFMKTNGWIWLNEEWQLWLPSYTCSAVLNLDSAQILSRFKGLSLQGLQCLITGVDPIFVLFTFARWSSQNSITVSSLGDKAPCHHQILGDVIKILICVVIEQICSKNQLCYNK